MSSPVPPMRTCSSGYSASLQDRQYDPPAYFELDEVAGAIQADRLDVAHIMAKSFKLEADSEGYPSSEIYGFLKSL